MPPCNNGPLCGSNTHLPWECYGCVRSPVKYSAATAADNAAVICGDTEIGPELFFRPHRTASSAVSVYRHALRIDLPQVLSPGMGIIAPSASPWLSGRGKKAPERGVRTIEVPFDGKSSYPQRDSENKTEAPALPPNPLPPLPNSFFVPSRHCFLTKRSQTPPSSPASSFKSSSLHVSDRATLPFAIRASSLIRTSGFGFRNSPRASFP